MHSATFNFVVIVTVDRALLVLLKGRVIELDIPLLNTHIVNAEVYITAL
jgi:hypothetical protein